MFLILRGSALCHVQLQVVRQRQQNKIRYWVGLYSNTQISSLNHALEIAGLRGPVPTPKMHCYGRLPLIASG